MTGLRRAELQKLGAGADPEPVGDPIPVQFNPTSLRLQMANSVEGGDSAARQARQYNGTSSTTLTVDLVFDTADEGTTDEAISVKQRTGQVVQFLLPGEGSQQPPPRVRFHWGDFVLDGIMSALTEDIDLFSGSGVPLRSKLSITIKEQDPRFVALESGPGSGGTPTGTEPGSGGPGPGATPGVVQADTSRPALGGESPPEFAARNGLDPAAWRAVADGLDGFELPTGAEIGFSASASTSLGLGVQAGFEAGVGASIETSLGLAGPPGAQREDGFALASAGGLSAAVATVRSHELTAAADAARQAFGAAATTAPRTAAGASTTSTSAPGLAGTRVPVVDPRAASYGRGVPLRPRIAASDRPTVGGRQASGAPSTTVDRTVPGWQTLPASSLWQIPADAAEAARRRPSPCGHHRGCGCTGGDGT